MIQMELQLFFSAYYLIVVYICTKNSENILNDIRVGADTNDWALADVLMDVCTDGQTDGLTDTHNVGGYNIGYTATF